MTTAVAKRIETPSIVIIWHCSPNLILPLETFIVVELLCCFNCFVCSPRIQNDMSEEKLDLDIYHFLKIGYIIYFINLFHCVLF